MMMMIAVLTLVTTNISERSTCENQMRQQWACSGQHEDKGWVGTTTTTRVDTSRGVRYAGSWKGRAIERGGGVG